MRPTTRRLAVEFCLDKWVSIEDLAAHIGKTRNETVHVVADANKIHRCFETIKADDVKGRPIVSVKATFMPEGLAKSVEKQIREVTIENLGSVVEMARDRKRQGICAAPECFPIRRVA